MDVPMSCSNTEIAQQRESDNDVNNGEENKSG